MWALINLHKKQKRKEKNYTGYNDDYTDNNCKMIYINIYIWKKRKNYQKLNTINQYYYYY